MTTPERLRDRAFIVTIGTFLMITPPILPLFGRDAALFGLPLLPVYCFTAWIVMIALGGLFATRLGALERDEPSRDGGPTERGDQ